MSGFEIKLPSSTGTYLLILKLDQESEIRVGKNRIHIFQPGWYLYLGSAFGPGGLQARLRRHIKRKKNNFWHIDYLRSESDLIEVWFQVPPEPNEHQIAAWLSSRDRITTPIPGFGSSDCTCESHLFFVENLDSLRRTRVNFQTGVPGDFPWCFVESIE